LHLLSKTLLFVLMYVVEGAMLIRRDPETCLGQFGIHSAVREEYEGHSYEDVAWTIASSERLANLFASRLRKRGSIPEDAAVEHINSLEQAEKYTQPSSHPVDMARHRRPELMDVLRSEVPEGSELLAGEARLWKERRLPTPYVYFLGLGKLLAEVEYDPADMAWYSKHRRVEGNRRVTGLVTPILHIATTKTNATAYR
jgi:hypothetical protein